MRTDAPKLISIIRQLIGEETEKPYALGTIPDSYTSGLPQVQFDNETTPSTRLRPHLDSYTPTAEDRVLLARVNGGWVILGKITN